MKGVILAGGKGTRLYPLTAVTNKHLIPVGNLPMIEYPIRTLTILGVDSISIVTGGEHFQAIAQYLGSVHPEINFSFHYQAQAGGIAQALAKTKPSVRDDKIAVILGDNIFDDNFFGVTKSFEQSDSGAILFLKKVPNEKLFYVDERGVRKAKYGMAEIRENEIINIEEKPKIPKSNLAVTGLYFYDSNVFEKIRRLKPSERGELEITDVNNMYVKERNVGYHVLGGFWSDSGTFESRKRCEEFVKNGLERSILSSLEKRVL